MTAKHAPAIDKGHGYVSMPTVPMAGVPMPPVVAMPAVSMPAVSMPAVSMPVVSRPAAAPVAAQRRPLRERARRWPKAVAFALGVALVGGATQWSLAQRREGPRISVPAAIEAEPASQAALAIKVEPSVDAPLPSNSFIRLRGFPSSVSLTEGHAIAPGAWAIPLFGLSSLKANVPAGVSGRAEIVITLVDVDGNTLAQARTALVIAAVAPPEKPAPPEAPAAAKVTVVPSALPPMRKVVPPPPAFSEEEREKAERMIANAEKHLQQGNIGAARGFLQRAADAGSAEAALKLGGTYDPAELALVGPLAASSADPKEARKWYEKARELGAPEAELRLGRLVGR